VTAKILPDNEFRAEKYAAKSLPAPIVKMRTGVTTAASVRTIVQHGHFEMARPSAAWAPPKTGKRPKTGAQFGCRQSA
jgi:hypothetical protein